MYETPKAEKQARVDLHKVHMGACLNGEAQLSLADGPCYSAKQAKDGRLLWKMNGRLARFADVLASLTHVYAQRMG